MWFSTIAASGHSEVAILALSASFREVSQGSISAKCSDCGGRVGTRLLPITSHYDPGLISSIR